MDVTRNVRFDSEAESLLFRKLPNYLPFAARSAKYSNKLATSKHRIVSPCDASDSIEHG